MAVYDGFFDFDQEVLESNGTYDREYNAADFTGFFEPTIGSGVYVGKDPDSMKVTYAEGAAHIAPGYLFLQGYWLKNTEDYTIPLAAAGTYAIAAHLDLSRRIIELAALPQADTYPDSLILALIDGAEVTDTRADPALCGLIDSAGNTASKAAYAVEYIDNELEARLAQAEADIAAQSAAMDAKIAEVGDQLSKLAPPPIGTVKFTASQNVDADWLPCDGRFINQADYPELVAALGKLTPSADKFKLLSDGEVPQQISNGVLYAGRMWVYSYSSAKLYGIDVEGGEPIKEVALTSTDANFKDFIIPSTERPLALSIVPHIDTPGAKLFLAQIIADGEISSFDKSENEVQTKSCFIIFGSEFDGTQSSLTMESPFSSIEVYAGTDTYGKANYNYIYIDSALAVPYVVSKSESGTEKYYCAVGQNKWTGSSGLPYYGGVTWSDGDEEAKRFEIGEGIYTGDTFNNQRFSCATKNKGDAVTVKFSYDSTTVRKYYSIASSPNLLYSGGGKITNTVEEYRQTKLPISIVGADKVVFSFDSDIIPWASITDIKVGSFNPKIHLPTTARVFVDAAAYLWGKAIYMFFVGTGIIFSRTLEEGSFGYLDTTAVLGTITQFGYLDYSQDEGTLYLLGQDTTNKVKLAKVVLNTLYDYANDGAWLPQIASDGVPAYIKAVVTEIPSGDREVTISVSSNTNIFPDYFGILFNGSRVATGKTYTRVIPVGTETFTVGLEKTDETSNTTASLYVDGSQLINMPAGAEVGTIRTLTLRWEDYSDTIELKGET